MMEQQQILTYLHAPAEDDGVHVPEADAGALPQAGAQPQGRGGEEDGHGASVAAARRVVGRRGRCLEVVRAVAVRRCNG